MSVIPASLWWGPTSKPLNVRFVKARFILVVLISQKMNLKYWLSICWVPFIGTAPPVKSLELLRLVFRLQDRLLKTEREMDNMKRDTNSKLSKIESEYEAVRDDLKALSQKIDDGIKHCMMDSEKLVKSMHNETKNQIEEVIKGMDNKVSTDELETALNQYTEETYSSKIKNEVDQHLNGMDSMILRVNTKIDKVRKKQ